MKENEEEEVKEGYGVADFSNNQELVQHLYDNAEKLVTDYGYKGKRVFNPLNKAYQAAQKKRRIQRAYYNDSYVKRLQPVLRHVSKLPAFYGEKYGVQKGKTFKKDNHEEQIIDSSDNGNTDISADLLSQKDS
jgi:hypothetical protein